MNTNIDTWKAFCPYSNNSSILCLDLAFYLTDICILQDYALLLN